MVEFVEESTWRKAGAPRLAIPEQIVTWLDESYRDESVVQIPAPAPEDRAEFDGLLKLHAKRRGKAVYIQEFISAEGDDWIRFKMRDKRPYRRSTHPREKR
jgi:hypothetical protein